MRFRAELVIAVTVMAVIVGFLTSPIGPQSMVDELKYGSMLSIGAGLLKAQKKNHH